MRSSRFRPLLLLPAVAILIATAILWGGLTLSKRTRVERIEQDRETVRRFGLVLQGRLDELEARYRQHLESLARTSPNDLFSLRDAIDRIVGVRQFSTLNPEGKVDLHLLSSQEAEDEANVPLPVFDRDDLPVGRRLDFLIEDRNSLGGGQAGAFGWIGSGDNLFYFTNLSERRTVLLLINRAVVIASIRDWLDGSLPSEIASSVHGEGALAVSLDGSVLASLGEDSGKDPDVILQLGSRFGNWQVHSRDPRRIVTEYHSGILGGAGLLALLVALAGGVSFFYLNRALRLAERRVSFVNHVSHELKTPLTNILLNTDLAADGASPAGVKRLAMVQEEARRLSRLIDNVLTYSQRQQAPPGIRLHPVDLGPLVNEIVAQFRPSLERRGITITITGDTAVMAAVNDDAFAQILGNLISNVEKYAAAGGIARIEMENYPGEVVIRLGDAGPGIPLQERERIFRPFYRLNDNIAEGASGTGLGLSIARDLAERMGGSLRVLTGNKEPGAVFELRLPAAAAEKVIAFPDSRAS